MGYEVEHHGGGGGGGGADGNATAGEGMGVRVMFVLEEGLVRTEDMDMLGEGGKG